MSKERGFLVLSRRQGESVLVGTDIIVTVTEIRGNSVRLSFEAPRDVPVMRKELDGLPDTRK